MTKTIEKVTKIWIDSKGPLIDGRPKASNFSFAVCLMMAISLTCGFLGGFMVADLSVDRDFSSTYENLLAELDASRRSIEREKQNLLAKSTEHHRQFDPQIARASDYDNASNQLHDQAIFSLFNKASSLLQQNDKAGACKELNNIVGQKNNSDDWRDNAQHFIDINCR